MKNFKEIAEKCLAGELSGTFKLVSGKLVFSDNLKRRPNDPSRKYPYQMYVDGVPFLYSINGTLFTLIGDSSDIIDFIPDNMQEQIKIDIPEGKVPVMEQTEKGVVITWKEKELTYYDVCNNLQKHNNLIGGCDNNSLSESFRNKMWTLRKLTNIRNYFGKPSGTESGFYIYKFSENEFKVATTGYPAIYASDVVAFTKREHAQAAINMLGNELKYLFEPW